MSNGGTPRGKQCADLNLVQDDHGYHDDKQRW
jgi:hypothetical protein